MCLKQNYLKENCEVKMLKIQASKRIKNSKIIKKKVKINSKGSPLRSKNVSKTKLFKGELRGKNVKNSSFKKNFEYNYYNVGAIISHFYPLSTSIHFLSFIY